MSQQSLGAVMDRFTNDPAFRKALESDPEGTIDRGGFDLNEQEREALRSMGISAPAVELKERVSKFVFSP